MGNTGSCRYLNNELTVIIVNREKYLALTEYENIIMSSGDLAVKRLALCAKGHRFDSIKRSKLFRGLISRLTTSWVAESFS